MCGRWALSSFEVVARIANPPPSLLSRYTRKERDFFFDYAEFVHRLINSEYVRENLRELTQLEEIRVNRELDFRVMVFPARPITGRPRSTLHGSYNQDAGQISLYPLKLPREWLRREGANVFKTPWKELSETQRKVMHEASLSAISTLIHEVLHVKFENRGYSRYAEEAIVRKLERKYAQEWVQRMDNLVEPRPFD